MDKNIQVIVGKDDKKVDVNDVKFLQELTSFDNKHRNSMRRRASSMCTFFLSTHLAYIYTCH